MKPMFSYFGSKYKLAKHYGAPRFDTVIEPFAGSAAYSLYWEPKNVILIDSNPIIVSVWEFLINSSPEEILRLPTEFNHVDELDICPGAKNFIGFWINKGSVSPGRQKGKWAREYSSSNDCKVWGDGVKRRVSEQVNKIKSWEIHQMNYFDIENFEAHWFIDPPYQIAGKLYPFNQLDYKNLATFACSRNGFVQVCENLGANWLPFEPFKDVNTYHHMRNKDGQKHERYSKEALFQVMN